jgi:hypothetical protein
MVNSVHKTARRHGRHLAAPHGQVAPASRTALLCESLLQPSTELREHAGVLLPC